MLFLTWVTMVSPISELSYVHAVQSMMGESMLSGGRVQSVMLGEKLE